MFRASIPQFPIAFRARALIAPALALAAGLSVMSKADPALACACCADSGQRTIETQPMAREDLKAELARIEFSGRGRLYMTAAGWDGIKGVNNPDKSQEYRATLMKDAETWRVVFVDKQGKYGTVGIKLPESVSVFAVDTDPSSADVAGGPELYKELRVAGPVHATGIFDPGTGAELTGELVLHGRGNGCTLASQFRAWTLSVAGPETQFRFIGALKAPATD